MFVRALADQGTTVQSQSVFSACVHTTGCTRVDTAGGSYANFNTSKYIDEVIEVDELEEGNLSAAAGELK